MGRLQGFLSRVRPGRTAVPAPAFQTRPVAAAPVGHGPAAPDSARLGFRFDRVKVPAAADPASSAPVQRMAAPLAAALTAPPGTGSRAAAAGAPIQRVKQVGTPFPAKVKKQVLSANRKANAGFHTCTNCNFQHAQKTYLKVAGKKSVGDGGFQVDHIKPFSKGGQGKLSNGRVLCGTCNTSRGNRNKFGSTGYAKFRGLDMGKKTHTMSLAYYNKRRAKWKRKNNWKPLVK